MTDWIPFFVSARFCKGKKAQNAAHFLGIHRHGHSHEFSIYSQKMRMEKKTCYGENGRDFIHQRVFSNHFDKNLFLFRPMYYTWIVSFVFFGYTSSKYISELVFFGICNNCGQAFENFKQNHYCKIVIIVWKLL